MILLLLLPVLVQSKVGPAAAPTDLEHENARLRQREDELRRALKETEDRLNLLQEGVVQLQEEYREESEDLQNQMDEMRTSVRELEQEKTGAERQAAKVAKAKKVRIMLLKSRQIRSNPVAKKFHVSSETNL